MRALANGDPEAAKSRLLRHLVAREIWEQNVDPEFLSSRSFGFAIQHKSRERLYRLLGIRDSVQVDVTAHALPDAELLELARRLGVVAQKALPPVAVSEAEP